MSRVPGHDLRSGNGGDRTAHRRVGQGVRAGHPACTFAGAERAAGTVGASPMPAFRSSTRFARCGRTRPSTTARRARAAYAMACRARSKRSRFATPITSRQSAKDCARKSRHAAFRRIESPSFPTQWTSRNSASVRSPMRSCESRLGLEGMTVIGFAGSFYAYEGLDLLIEATALLAPTTRNLRVLLVGGGAPGSEPQGDGRRTRARRSRDLRRQGTARRRAALLRSHRRSRLSAPPDATHRNRHAAEAAGGDGAGADVRGLRCRRPSRARPRWRDRLPVSGRRCVQRSRTRSNPCSNAGPIGHASASRREDSSKRSAPGPAAWLATPSRTRRSDLARARPGPHLKQQRS